MANSDTPFGLRPVMYADGSPYNGAARMYYKVSTDTIPLFIGDPVKLTGTGDTTGKYASVARAAAGDPILGVVVGFKPDHAAAIYSAASTEGYPLVADSPDLLFEVQEDSVSSDLAKTSLGLNANLIIAVGSTTTGLSAVELDSDSAGTDPALDFQIVALSPREDNEIGTNAKWLVKANNHHRRGGAASGTVGI